MSIGEVTKRFRHGRTYAKMFLGEGSNLKLSTNLIFILSTLKWIHSRATQEVQFVWRTDNKNFTKPRLLNNFGTL